MELPDEDLLIHREGPPQETYVPSVRFTTPGATYSPWKQGSGRGNHVFLPGVTCRGGVKRPLT